MTEHTEPEDRPANSESANTGQLLAGLQDTDHAKGLASVAALRTLVDKAEATHVRRARENGWTWRQIGDVLGVSRQSVHKKYQGGRRYS
jgi:hypothetical protein